jgi:hypothetical protein
MSSSGLSDAEIRGGYRPPTGPLLQRRPDEVAQCRAAECLNPRLNSGDFYDILIRASANDSRLPLEIVLCQACGERIFRPIT